MSVLDAYQKAAPKMESEAPPDAMEPGEYPVEVTGFSLAIREGESQKTGEPYRFAEGRLTLRVLDGPMKGNTLFLGAGSGKGRVSLTIPDTTAKIEVGLRKQINYLVQHTYDALGFGKKWDPSWQRIEKPHPTVAGKTVTSFKGACLTGEVLTQIADNEAAAKELAGMLIGCKALVTVTTGKADSGKEYNNFKSIRPLNDATSADWKAKQSGVAPAAAAAGTGKYA